VKEVERLKEQQKRNNWRNKNQEGRNQLMFKVGEGVLGRLNLGGAGAGLNRQSNQELS